MVPVTTVVDPRKIVDFMPFHTMEYITIDKPTTSPTPVIQALNYHFRYSNTEFLRISH